MNDGEIVGGVCYRPHFTQGFAEIAFCAVTATRQVKGFGTRMMNQLKQAAKKDGIEYFLTYADNYAIGYFKKQGFSRQVTMKRERWVGFIKDYDGGTLMECSISEHIDYTNLPKMIEAQRQAILERMRTMSSSHVMQTPITERHTFPLDEHGDVIGSRGPIQTAADIPGLAETGVQLPRYEYTLAGEKSTLSAIIERALQALVSHADSWPFLAPVDVTEAPDYYEVIKRPIDLAMAQRRLEIGARARAAPVRRAPGGAEQPCACAIASATAILPAAGYYRTLRMFTADIRMMCKNCLTYNGEENIYADCANTMISLHDSMLSDAQEVRCDAEAAG